MADVSMDNPMTYDWLPRIQSPEDIRGLTIADLKEIAADIRNLIAATCSMNGGHMGSSLGATELIIALHYLFDTPNDRLVFDVGHQAYAHKILTGRYDRFHTIRTHNGLDPFLKRHESIYDCYGAGHASTAISAALGMAKARDLLGLSHRIVAITGDGAMTGGICYEALNNAGELGADMLVILNDNEMSISKNVGAIHHYFNRLITHSFYNDGKNKAEDLIQKFSAGIGRKVIDLTHKVEEHIKGLLVPGVFFEELGFRYIGPIDGHSFETLLPTLKNVKEFRGPVLLHVVTQKGRGFVYSEKEPTVYHGPKNFIIETGEFKPPSKTTPPTFTDVFGDTLVNLAKDDARMVVVTPAMSVGSGLTKFQENYPDRFFDCGIAEEHAVIFGAGLAVEGLRPFVSIYSTFMQRAFDCILHDVALQNLPVRLALDRGGLVGADGPTHHGIFDFAYLRIIPGMIIMAPKDEDELRRMIRTAQLYDEGPIAFRYPRDNGLGVALSDPLEPLEIGKAERLRRGEDACIWAIGRMVPEAMSVAHQLSKEGIEVEVINARFVKPLDVEMLADCAARHSLIYTWEDHAKAGGFGSAINEALQEMGTARQATVFGLPDRWIEHGDVARLWAENGMDEGSVAEKIRADLLMAPQTPQCRQQPVYKYQDIL